MHTVGSAEEARRAVGCGVDIIVAQGWEAGGHVWGCVATLPLVPAVVDAVAPIPVIAAGGIGDARGVAAVLALGAQAAWVGTRFLLADEMPIHEEYRRLLIAAGETDAEWYANLYEVGWPNAPHRALHNSTAERWEAAGRPAPGSRPGEGEVIAHLASDDAILRYSPAPPMVGTTGEIEALSLWAGQSVALATQATARCGNRGRTRLALVAPIRVEVSPRQSSRAGDTSAMADANARPWLFPRIRGHDEHQCRTVRRAPHQTSEPGRGRDATRSPIALSGASPNDGRSPLQRRQRHAAPCQACDSRAVRGAGGPDVRGAGRRVARQSRVSRGCEGHGGNSARVMVSTLPPWCDRSRLAPSDHCRHRRAVTELSAKR